MESLGPVLLRHAIFWTACIVFFGGLERLFPRVPSQRLLRKDTGENVAWLVFNRLMHLTWLGPFIGVIVLQWNRVGDLLGEQIPLLADFAHRPLWLKLAVMYFLMDFLGWYIHYLQHQIRFLSRFHVLHHSSESLDWLASLRTHWVDSMLVDFGKAAPLLLLPGSDAAYKMIGLLAFLNAFFLHSNTRIGPRADRPILKQVFGWLGSPAFHYWHHSAANELEKGQNFGGFTLIWDRLFGTLYLPPSQPARIGLLHPEKCKPSFPRRIVDPFLPGAYDLR